MQWFFTIFEPLQVLQEQDAKFKWDSLKYSTGMAWRNLKKFSTNEGIEKQKLREFFIPENKQIIQEIIWKLKNGLKLAQMNEFLFKWTMHNANYCIKSLQNL